LDPFCGCGTAIATAQRLNRSWIGIDITHLAITLIKHRLFNAYGDEAKYEVVGEPVSLPDAEQLAKDDAYQFQWWALGLVDARPVEQKKGADQGIDGRLYFHDDLKPGNTKQIVISVKSGHIPPAHIRELRGVIEREGAAIGVLITLQEPTKPMRREAANAGFYEPDGKKSKHPRLQILTIEELLSGARIDYPIARTNITFRKARRVKKAFGIYQSLPFDRVELPQAAETSEADKYGSEDDE
ncbi:MAG: restriction endonuclease, partial [Blastocatellia bacterium]